MYFHEYQFWNYWNLLLNCLSALQTGLGEIYRIFVLQYLKNP